MLDDPIARRYFVMNFFDGIMTAFGLLVGGALAIGDSLAIIKAGIGTSIAIAISGFFGAYAAERTEREIEMREIERHTFGSLRGSLLEKEAHRKSVELAIIDAVSPFLGAILPILPFFLSARGLVGFNQALSVSFAASFALLLFLGGYIGKLMKRNPWKSAVAFALGGVLVGILFSLFDILLR